MDSHPSRRQFLQAGLALPAAGLVSSSGLNSTFLGSSSAPQVVYRPLGKTGLKVTGVGYGIGFVPVPEVVARAIDMGINYYDTSRDYGDSEKIFSSVIKGKRADTAGLLPHVLSMQRTLSKGTTRSGHAAFSVVSRLLRRLPSRDGKLPRSGERSSGYRLQRL
jgi:hypothetical protein